MHDPDTIDIIRNTSDGAILLRPQGEIDLGRSPALRTHLNRAAREKPTALIVNLIDVPYMDSSGVATLIEAMQTARRVGSRLILCGLQERVHSVFEIARLDMVFTIVDTPDQALEKILS